MFGSTALEVAIGLILFFLMASLLCAAIREAIEAVLKSRARDLERGLRSLLDDPNGKGLTSEILNHGLVSALFVGQYDPDKLKLFDKKTGEKHLEIGDRSNLPSYIPARQFAAALLDIAARGAVRDPGAISILQKSADDVRLGVLALPEGRVQRALLSALDNAGQDAEKLRTEVETWFNDSMERVSGWYRRRTQLILFFVGLGVAALLNLDALTVASRLVQDPALRALAMAQAEKTVAAPPSSDEANEQARTKVELGLAQTAFDAAREKLATEPQSSDLAAAESKAKEELHRAQIAFDAAHSHAFETARANIESVGFPVGWRISEEPLVYSFRLPIPGPQFCPKLKAGKCDGVSNDTATLIATFTLTILGWLVTALAVTLGAPFWFDLLNKFMAMRSTVKPSANEKPDEQSKPSPSSLSAAAPAAAGQAGSNPQTAVSARQPGQESLESDLETWPETDFNEWKDGAKNPEEIDL